MRIEKVDTNTIDVDFTDDELSEASVIAMSDVHIDSVKCDLNLLNKHLKLAEELKAPVLIAGDLFDAMQGHDDPRRSYNELRTEYKQDDYLDLIVEDTVKVLGKYDLHYIVGMGNHETSVLRKMNISLTDRLCYALNSNGGHAYSAGYWGFMRIRMGYKKQPKRKMPRGIKTLYWHHGNSATAHVTKGLIENARQAPYLPDADIVLNGHNHKNYLTSDSRLRLNSRGKVYEDMIWFLRTPGYKTSGLAYGDKYGFDVEKNPAPTSRGCIRLDFQYDKSLSTVSFRPVPYFEY